MLARERALQAAMLASDVDGLDRLLHSELLAVGPDGQLADKAMDLEAHRSGAFEIFELIEEEMRLKVVGETALTYVVLAIRGRSTARTCPVATAARARGRAPPASGRSSERTSVRQAEPHRGATARGGLRDDHPAVRLDDPPAHSETDAAARVVPNVPGQYQRAEESQSSDADPNAPLAVPGGIEHGRRPRADPDVD